MNSRASQFFLLLLLFFPFIFSSIFGHLSVLEWGCSVNSLTWEYLSQLFLLCGEDISSSDSMSQPMAWLELYILQRRASSFYVLCTSIYATLSFGVRISRYDLFNVWDKQAISLGEKLDSSIFRVPCQTWRKNLCLVHQTSNVTSPQYAPKFGWRYSVH